MNPLHVAVVVVALLVAFLCGGAFVEGEAGDEEEEEGQEEGAEDGGVEGVVGGFGDGACGGGGYAYHVDGWMGGSHVRLASVGLVWSEVEDLQNCSRISPK